MKPKRWQVEYDGRIFIVYNETADGASDHVREHLGRELGDKAAEVLLVMRPAPRLNATRGYVDNMKGGQR